MNYTRSAFTVEANDPDRKHDPKPPAAVLRLPERPFDVGPYAAGHADRPLYPADLLAPETEICKPPGLQKIIGCDEKLLDVFEQIENVAAYNYPVHIFGETGTGKELVAEAIHATSPRKGGPFVPINCGALPENLIESELFGHARGAFSGAVRSRKGRFELADGGTIFLDEVAELSKYMQVKLLRFLQDGKFEKVGGEKTVSVDVRIISATNKDLKAEMGQGLFREDLYYRINVIPLNMPPLRERRRDIPLLAGYFLDQAAARYQLPPTALTPAALQSLAAHDWPGNVRELQNAIQFALVRSRGRTIQNTDLQDKVSAKTHGGMPPGPARKLNAMRVRYAMEKSGGNKAKAARLLKVGRATLYRFFEDFPELQPEF